MKLFTFTAPSPALALQKAQKACGRDALVVSTKQIRKKSLSQDALYELVIAVEDSVMLKKETKKPEIKPIFDDEIMANISQTARQLSRLDTLSEPFESITPTNKLDEVKKEIKNDEFTQIISYFETSSKLSQILYSINEIC